jgi:small GTP-binding protein
MAVEIKRKILLLGDGAVGKTSLIRKFVTDQFDDKYIASIGTKVTKKVINFKLKDDELNLVLLIWDILGQSDFKGVIGASFYGASGAFLVADMTRRPTLENLKNVWLPRVEEVAKDLPIVFLGNKADLKDNYAFREKDLAELADTTMPRTF